MTRHVFNCLECGAENELDPSVVALCSEVWTDCNECGKKQRIPLHGADA